MGLGLRGILDVVIRSKINKKDEQKNGLVVLVQFGVCQIVFFGG